MSSLMQPTEVTSPRIMQSEEVKLMRLEKDSLYFEARVITMVGSLHWFGDTYFAEELLKLATKTVYIRDDRRYLYVYRIKEDALFNVEKIQTTFELVCKLKKHDDKRRYGN